MKEVMKRKEKNGNIQEERVKEEAKRSSRRS